MSVTARRARQARESIRAYKARQTAPDHGRDSQGVPSDPSFFLPGGTDTTALYLTEPFAEHANFFSVVSALAWAFIQAPLQLGRWGANNAFVPDESHPLDAFLRRPNGLCSGELFWWLRLVHLATVGEAFLVLEGPDGHPRASAAVVPTRGFLLPGGRRWTPTERIDDDGLPSGWVFQTPSGKQAYLRHELVYWRYPHPSNPLRGLAPARPATALLLADTYADRYQVATFKNDAKPGGVLVNKQVPRLTDAQFAQVREQWEDRHQGADKVRQVALLTGGWEYQALAFSPQDLEYLNQRRYTREQLCGVFRVPKWMLSSTDDVNRAISAEMRASFFEDVIASQQKLAVGDLEAQLLHGIDPTLTARFDLDQVPAMREARRARWAAAKTAIDLGVTLREADRQFDLGIQETPPGFDTVYKPAGIQVVNADGTITPPMFGGFGAPGQFGLALPWAPQTPTEPAVVPVGLAAQVARTPQERARLLGYENSDAWRHLSWRAKLAWVQRRQQWRRWMEGVREPADTAVADVIGPWLADLATEILRRFKEAAERSRGIQGARNGGHRDVGPLQLEDMLFSTAETGAKLAAKMRPAAVQIARLSAAYTTGELGSYTEVDVLDPTVHAFIEERMQKLVSDYQGSLPNAVREQLSLTLQEGFAAGETIQQLRTRVATVADALKDPARTLRIARTEAGTLANGLRYVVAEPHVDDGEWLTAGDDQVRPEHQADEDFSTATPVPVGTRFPNTGLLYPQESGGPPGMVIACRCLHLLLPRSEA